MTYENLLTAEIDLPMLPGVFYRKFLGEADYARMVEIKNACHRADGVEEVLSVAELANEYAHLKNCDPQTDMLMIEVDGQLVAQGGVQWRDDDAGNRIYEQEADVHPDWRHLGLQRVLYEFNEARARQLAAQLNGLAGVNAETVNPSRSNLPGSDLTGLAANWMSVWLPNTAPDEMSLLQEMGYAPARYFYLMCHNLNSIPCIKMPAGIEMRLVQPEHLRTIWDAKEEAFADHWGHVDRGEEGFREWRDDPTEEHHLWQVAWDVNSDEVAGLSINTIYYTDNDFYGFKRGWVETLGVRRNWRGKGLAKALLANSLRKLHVQGMTEAMLGVDAANPTGALQLYESMGFCRDKESAVWRKRIG